MLLHHLHHRQMLARSRRVSQLISSINTFTTDSRVGAPDLLNSIGPSVEAVTCQFIGIHRAPGRRASSEVVTHFWGISETFRLVGIHGAIDQIVRPEHRRGARGKTDRQRK